MRPNATDGFGPDRAAVRGDGTFRRSPICRTLAERLSSLGPGPSGVAAAPQSSQHAARVIAPRCGWRCSSPTSRRTPARCCGPAPAWASAPTSSSRPASRRPTATSAAPGWTTSTRSTSGATRPSRPSRRGAPAELPRPRLVLLTTAAEADYRDAAFRPGDVLMVGRESAGVPEEVHAAADLRVAVPMRPGFRSLNVAVAAAMVLGEALRQLR